MAVYLGDLLDLKEPLAALKANKLVFKKYANLGDYRVFITPLSASFQSVKGSNNYKSVKIFHGGFQNVTVAEFLEVLGNAAPIDVVLPLTEDTSFNEKTGFKSQVRCIRKSLSFLDKTLHARKQGPLNRDCKIFGWIHGSRKQELTL